jgi:hypothetical protein
MADYDRSETCETRVDEEFLRQRLSMSGDISKEKPLIAETINEYGGR